MRHGKSGRTLGKTHSHRKAMMGNMAASILSHKSIITTTPKAKEARGVVERLITFAKKNDLAARRMVMRTIKDKELVRELFDEIGPKFADRNGGYTRVIKLGNRQGDGASMAIFELVGYEGTKAAKIEKQRQKREEKVAKKKKEIEEAAAQAQQQQQQPQEEEEAPKK
ncbi:MAG TPA: 50S ribosomal protein L17 [bacterium]|nr:50S ribosomal protein L17 [bacterium]HPR88537.1 50S ribosomal protein L17 [bacterium]